MIHDNKKPGAMRRPGKDKSPTKHNLITAAQASIHGRIELQARLSQANRKPWRKEEYPDLGRLVEAARKAASERCRQSGRLVFTFKGRNYAARLTNLGRVIVEDHRTGRYLASSGCFAL